MLDGIWTQPLLSTPFWVLPITIFISFLLRGFSSGAFRSGFPYCSEELGGLNKEKSLSRKGGQETDFDTPPVLGGAALLDTSAPAVYKIQGPYGTRSFLHRWC